MFREQRSVRRACGAHAPIYDNSMAFRCLRLLALACTGLAAACSSDDGGSAPVATGGSGGGGASLTPAGHQVLTCLDELDLVVAQAAAKALTQLDDLSEGQKAPKKKAGAKGTGQ